MGGDEGGGIWTPRCLYWRVGTPLETDFPENSTNNFWDFWFYKFLSEILVWWKSVSSEEVLKDASITFDRLAFSFDSMVYDLHNWIFRHAWDFSKKPGMRLIFGGPIRCGWSTFSEIDPKNVRRFAAILLSKKFSPLRGDFTLKKIFAASRRFLL